MAAIRTPLAPKSRSQWFTSQKLGAKFFAFNVDADFNDAVDALMVVDLTQTERQRLDRYLTPEGAAFFSEVSRRQSESADTEPGPPGPLER